jgi:transcriptional regulator with XRE-family HTH domain
VALGGILPELMRRRVPGLRRQEVAELAGVSEDWYRWFESGRPISVSPKFLARLVRVLKLNPYDELTLYHLAMADLYRAERNAALGPSPSEPPRLGPIRFPCEIDEARRIFDAGREAFLTSHLQPSSVRPRVCASWERCRRSDVDPSILEAPLALCSDDALKEAREGSRDLLRAASPVVAELAATLAECGYAVGLTDAEGRVLKIEGDFKALHLIARFGIVPGADLSEEAAGTNGVGTTIADCRPLQLMSGEHFVQGGQPLECTGAPIRGREGTISGVLVVMSDYRLVRPALLSAVTRCALEAEEELVKPAMPITRVQDSELVVA